MDQTSALTRKLRLCIDGGALPISIKRRFLRFGRKTDVPSAATPRGIASEPCDIVFMGWANIKYCRTIKKSLLEF
jgi:hypothetical protein